MQISGVQVHYVYTCTCTLWNHSCHVTDLIIVIILCFVLCLYLVALHSFSDYYTCIMNALCTVYMFMYIYIPYTKSYACNMLYSADNMHQFWHLFVACFIYIHMHAVCMFHVTCMDLGRFPYVLHACYMHVTI